MSTIQAIKQLEERNVASEIVLMVWSDRMDLVALANIKGEVALHRLTWTKAWSLAPPKDGLAVKAITWRPDGKIIAVAYSSGQVMLVKVENKSVLYSIEVKSDITCLNWLQDKTSTKAKNPSDEESKQSEYMKYIDLSANFLPEASSPLFDSSTDEAHKTNLLQEQTDLNLLLIGTGGGVVQIRVFGCFHCATLNLNSFLNSSCSVQNVHLSETLNRMFVTVRECDIVKLLCFNSNIFHSHMNELFAVALKHIKVTSLLNCLQSTLTTIRESWESILLEMDNKLSKYASKVPEGGVTADFLDLLVFGFCSDEMKEFLIHDLTKKGLEKFGQTIEMSYSNIQKLVLKYVMKFGQNITYHLAELRGMARFEGRYKILGLQETAITDAILSNGAFLIKGGEMQQIINHSIINYKAFFCWLYTAIMHVLEEPIPNEIPKMTQQDLAYITEFLQNFDRIGSNSQNGFIMERLGQYLEDKPLTIEPDMTGNEWSLFLAQNDCLRKHPCILKHYTKMSLVQQYQHLNTQIDAIFTAPKDIITQQFDLEHSFDCFQYGGAVLQTSQINMNNSSAIFAFLEPPDAILTLHLSFEADWVPKCGRIVFPEDNSDQNYRVLDLKLYSSAVISVLLQDKAGRASVLCQVSIGGAFEQLASVHDRYIFDSAANINGTALVPQLFKHIDGMFGAQFAVSGSRKVGIVLAENRRKVRLYEMEGEEEEDEDADVTNSTVRESDMSVQDGSSV